MKRDNVPQPRQFPKVLTLKGLEFKPVALNCFLKSLTPFVYVVDMKFTGEIGKVNKITNNNTLWHLYDTI